MNLTAEQMAVTAAEDEQNYFFGSAQREAPI
jgi:hypothetical protein